MKLEEVVHCCVFPDAGLEAKGYSGDFGWRGRGAEAEFGGVCGHRQVVWALYDKMYGFISFLLSACMPQNFDRGIQVEVSQRNTYGHRGLRCFVAELGAASEIAKNCLSNAGTTAGNGHKALS